jgi:hypothetical protein
MLSPVVARDVRERPRAGYIVAFLQQLTALDVAKDGGGEPTEKP